MRTFLPPVIAILSPLSLYAGETTGGTSPVDPGPRRIVVNADGLNAADPDATDPLQAAIDEAAVSGGGMVVVSPGEYPCRGLTMKSGVHLRLEEGARITGKWDLPGDPPDAFVSAVGARGVRISGAGIFDARGTAERFPKDKKRPKGFLFEECRDVTISGITFRNSASWGLHFSACDDLTVEGVTVFNHNNHNNDGIDLCDCHRARISNCTISSDDDGICLKSFLPRGCRDIEVTDCTVGSHCNALKIGTESFGPFKNINIHDCRVVRAKSDEVFFGTVNGQSAINLNSADGAEIDNVRLANIDISSGTSIPFGIKIGARLRKYSNASARPVGRIRNVTLEQVRARGCETSPHSCLVAGEAVDGARHYLENIVLRDIDIHFSGKPHAVGFGLVGENPTGYPRANVLGALPAWGLFARYIRGLRMERVNFTSDAAESREMIVCEDVVDLVTDDATLPAKVARQEALLAGLRAQKQGAGPQQDALRTQLDALLAQKRAHLIGIRKASVSPTFPFGSGDFEKAFLPETGPEQVEWRTATLEEHGFLDFRKIHKEPENCITYVRVELQADQDCRAILSLGYDDGIKALVNGTRVFSDHAVSHSYREGQSLVDVELSKGRNVLLFGITQGNGGHKFGIEAYAIGSATIREAAPE